MVLLGRSEWPEMRVGMIRAISIPGVGIEVGAQGRNPGYVVTLCRGLIFPARFFGVPTPVPAQFLAYPSGRKCSRMSAVSGSSRRDQYSPENGNLVGGAIEIPSFR
jgi:hypothetical protein